MGCYTSPHLLEYRERIQLPDGLVSEVQLVDAFARIEAVRGLVSLSIFEYGTLAALLCFAESELDVAILEVGLGGRLDAVNIIDADAVLISTIGLDHQDWLGTDLQQIGREKAGVLRAGQVAVYADQPAVQSVIVSAAKLACQLRRPAQDYRYWRRTDHWYFHDHIHALRLTWPAALQAPVQIHNLAACVALTLALEPAFDYQAIASGVADARIAGRLQQLSEVPEVWLDIAHNPQAAASLRDWLQSRPKRPTLALFGALLDKDVAGVVAALDGVIDQWLLVPLDQLSPRGLSVAELLQRLPTSIQCTTANAVHAGLETALSQASEQNFPLVGLWVVRTGRAGAALARLGTTRAGGVNRQRKTVSLDLQGLATSMKATSV